MAKSGIEHIDVGDELTKAEWESEQSHALVHGNAFPGGPVERQLFYRDDLNTLYIYNGTAWISSDVTSHAALTTGIHGVGALHAAGFHSAGQAVSKVIWKDASVNVLTDLARAATLDWTDLDLTAATSANAKLAILRMTFLINAYTDGDLVLTVRKNGTTPDVATEILILAADAAVGGRVQAPSVIVGLDAGQVVEYKITITGTATISSYIDILGYIE